MTTRAHDLESLNDADRATLETWLVDFDLTWHPDRLRSYMATLPDTTWRSAAMMELVRIDLERRRAASCPLTIDNYHDELVSLGPWPELRASLLDSVERLGLATTRDSEYANNVRTWGAVAGGSGGTWTDQELNRLLERTGRYKIVRCLGSGGMGVVVLVSDTHLQRQVALKVPRKELVLDPVIRTRFLREARSAAVLSHPGICAVYDVGMWSEVPYLTMEYIAGESLETMIRRCGAREPAQALAVVRQIALALSAAHAAGVVHRDLKPANVLLRSDGQAVVTDFGLARRFDVTDPRLTHSGSLLGSPVYLAPEQVSAADDVGPSADVYALGAILFELLTGRAPFTGNLGDILTAKVTGRLPPWSECNADVEVAELGRQMMTRERSQRISAMDEVVHRIDRMGLSRTVAWPNARRRRTVGTLMGLLLLVCFAWQLRPWLGQIAESEIQQDSASPSPQDIEQVIALLAAPDVNVRRDAAVTLREWHATQAVEALARRVADATGDNIFADDKDEALRALTTLAPGRADAAVSAALDSSNVRVRQWAAANIVQCTLSDRSNLPQVRTLLGKALSDAHRLVRAAAAETIDARIADDQLLQQLAQVIVRPEGDGIFMEDKDAAVVVLRKLHPDRVAPAVRESLKSENPSVRQWAAKQLAHDKEVESTRALVTALKDTDRDVRAFAATSLAERHDPQVISALRDRVADDLGNRIFTQDKDAAWRTLESLSAVDAQAALDDATKSRNPEVREWALHRLSRRQQE